MNWVGIGLGLFSAFAIGAGFMWVIRFEYLVGARPWKWVAAGGVLICAASLFMPNFLMSALVGIMGGGITWGAVELPHQEERVDHGLFKAHPDRAQRRRANQGGQGHDHGHGDRPGLGKWWSF